MKSPQTEKTATACQKTPLERAKAALNGDSNDEEHDALLALVESVEASVNNAGALAEALRDCVTTPGALAERSHEYALRRLATITETAREALARWESEAGQ